MSDINIDEIIWPCTLSKQLKRQLLSISESGEGLPASQNKQYFPGLYYIKSGLATISILSENMNNTLGFVLGEKDWLGANAIGYMDELYLLSVELEPIKHLFFCKEKVINLAQTTPEVYKLLFHCLQKDQPKHWQVTLNTLHDKEVRIVYTLLSLAGKKTVIKGAKISIKITQEQLCIVTGLSRPRVNEVLKAIEKAHEISIERGTIHINDIKALGSRLDQLNTMFNDPR